MQIRLGGGGLSVVVPVYNAAKTIVECIQSIQNQTFSKLQIICVNDGSTDNSLDLINDLAKNDSRILIVNQENCGVSCARNKGISVADFEYITFVDSDDTIEPTMYEKMLEEMQLYTADCVICGSNEYKFDGKVLNFTVPYKNKLLSSKQEVVEKFIKPLFFASNINIAICVRACVWNKIFLKKIIIDNKIKFNETRFNGEDWQFCLEYFSNCNSIYFLDECFYNYIHHGRESLVTRYRDNFLEICLADRKMFRRLYPEFNWDELEKVKDYLDCSIKASHYYRTRLKGKEKRKKVKNIYFVCKNDDLYCEYVKRIGGICDFCFKRQFLFRIYVFLKSSPKVLKSKTILFLIKIKRMIKK